MKSRLLILSLFMSMVFAGFQSKAQNLLSLKEAVKIGLEENLDIEIADIREAQAQINTGKGAAGMLPSVTAQGDISYNVSNTRQQFLDGRANAIPLGTAFRANVGARMDWTVFDGMAMYVRRDLLDDELELASIEVKEQAQTLGANISVTYQDLVLQAELIEILEENAAYLEDLVELSEAKLEIGSISKLEVLQAQTDLNEVEGARQLAMMNYELSVAELNNSLNREASNYFTVDTSFLIPANPPDYDVWVEKALRSNFGIKRSRKSLQMAQRNIELAEAQMKPRVNLNAGFDIGYLNSTFGFLVSNRSVGPFVGASVSYNIFDGYRVNREIELAKLQTQISELSIDRLSLGLKNNLFIFYQRFQYHAKQVEIEEGNLELADENFRLGEALFRNGGISQFDLRQIRIQKLAIERRLISARYQMAVAYIRMLELSGEPWL
ncbi:TolC family protein [Portibacter marinus]|uniref:TolC family protein n=1 Tax=Portibacter marinus TaxID=2898660 RepID=UPI001F4091C2|nr:TolC family protein [Portibacter marinus]